MKKFLILILSFIIVLFIIDISWGFLCSILQSQAKGGSTEKFYYVAEKMNEDVVLMGSSRMAHHYNPSIIEDSLNMTCYNIGADGNGIIMQYGFYKLFSERYVPKVIIYDISRFDIYQDDNIKYLDWLRPYYNSKSIQQIFQDVDSQESLKMHSNFYKYNTKWISIVSNFIHPVEKYKNGFQPKNGKLNYNPEPNEEEVLLIDTLKMNYLKQLITSTKESGCLLIFMVSPNYCNNHSEKFYEPVIKLAEENDIPFWNYDLDEKFVGHKEMFYEPTHLNADGANLYTAEVARKLRDYLVNNL